MIQLILDKKKEIERICAEHQVRSLSLTGSGLSGTWDPNISDIDLIIEFQSMSPADHAESYFSILEEFEDLFGYPIDLIEMCAVTNPHLRESFASTQESLYALT
ncbi:MAG: nucleotidyltransferase domain-containing protein [Methanospirillum sp.]|uniref:nucleotidyltransferase family protein n=1 Tax=Methanospirillum sp. TaxID=45200 RepID=UPI00236A4869|nr:nucleotidyltransferase domain-containing protein [Methanospirillum sp.]MDD1728864.1 nucleotidyltransferase domain-containing protein [Methanospirillum sp.]